MKTARQLGVIQLDSVNITVRTHYMPLFSRLGPYRPELLDDLAYKDRRLFECWGHMASYMPTDDYPLLRRRAIELADPKKSRWAMYYADWVKGNRTFIEKVVAEIEEQGPLGVSDLSDPGRRTGPWWGRSRGKVALEYLFGSGRLMASHRRNFERIYDLTERVIPRAFQDAQIPDAPDVDRILISKASKALGVATTKDLADYFRISTKRAQVAISALVEGDELQEVAVDGWKVPAFMPAGTRIPKELKTAALLSPFDNLIWFRERVERLFDFYYRIEIYVPEPKRQYGYYVYPFLLDDRLVGRVDLKADRKEGRLLAKGSYFEDGVDRKRAAKALAVELERMSSWLGLNSVAVSRKGNAATDLKAAL